MVVPAYPGITSAVGRSSTAWKGSGKRSARGTDMYEQYYSLKERPFSLTPDPDFLFLSESHQRALDHLLFGLESGDGFIVVTGDIVDTGQPEEYAKAARHLARIPVPANVCIANHDFQIPFDAVLPGPRPTTSRTMRVGAAAAWDTENSADEDAIGVVLDGAFEHRAPSAPQLTAAARHKHTPRPCSP